MTNREERGEKLQLQFPVAGPGGVAIGELFLRRPKVRDMLAGDKAGGTDAEKEIRTFANLCEVSPDVIEGLDMADYRKLQKVYEGFLS